MIIFVILISTMPYVWLELGPCDKDYFYIRGNNNSRSLAGSPQRSILRSSNNRNEECSKNSDELFLSSCISGTDRRGTHTIRRWDRHGHPVKEKSPILRKEFNSQRRNLRFIKGNHRNVCYGLIRYSNVSLDKTQRKFRRLRRRRHDSLNEPG